MACGCGFEGYCSIVPKVLNLFIFSRDPIALAECLKGGLQNICGMLKKREKLRTIELCFIIMDLRRNNRTYIKNISYNIVRWGSEGGPWRGMGYHVGSELVRKNWSGKACPFRPKSLARSEAVAWQNKKEKAPTRTAGAKKKRGAVAPRRIT